MGKYKIFVDGSSGTTGLRIADRLAERDEFEILKISEADRKDVRARAAVINESDLSFLCLPDDRVQQQDIVITLQDEEVSTMGGNSNGSFFVNAPHVDSVGAILVSPSNVVSAKVIESL